MEKYARQAVSEGVKNADDLRVGGDSEIYRVLNLHYNRNNHIEVNWRCTRNINVIKRYESQLYKRNHLFPPPPWYSQFHISLVVKKSKEETVVQPPARPMIRQSNFVPFSGIELSESKFRWGRENWPGVGDSAIIRRSAMTAPPFTSPFSSRGTLLNEFELVCVSVE